MKITRCKTNHLNNPMGFAMDPTVLSWSVEDALSKVQNEARIIISEKEDLTDVVLDTGYANDIDNRGFTVSLDLKSRSKYYWQVEVVGDVDRALSDVHWFETGKMKDEWEGSWVSVPWEDQSVSPYMRRSFSIDQEIQEARAYIIGLGLYEMSINGQRVGEERFTPYCTAYDAWLQYQTYDVTEQLKTGDNAVGVLLGNGWAKGPFGTFGPMNTPYIDEFALLAEIRITYTDGTEEVIGTDEAWLCHASPVLEDTIYDGEVFDARKVISDWAQPGCNIEGWTSAITYEPKGLGPVEDRMSPPVIIKEEIQPVELIQTPAGEWVLDIGQNMVGWLRMKVNEAKGTKVTLSHGEVLQEGNFYRENLRNAKAQYTYISDGTEQVVEPHFTYFGFRYVKLEGFTGRPKIEDFTACLVYSDLETIGHIETSDPLVNRLFQNALWSQKDNFLDVPTDCPQRDERMGWTGDAQVFAGTASFNMDTYAFFSKFLRDLYEEQKFSEGMVAATVPTFSKIKHKESSFIAGGACAWSDAATVIPWEVYVHTGDTTILKHQYQSMKDWVDWIISRDQASGDNKLWLTDFQFGDWLALDGPVKGGVMGGTDNGLLASAYYRLSSNIVAKAAAVLGYDEDAEYYKERSEAVKQAIQDEYFSKSGRSTISTQTAHVAALHFDLVPDHVKSRILEDLKVLLRKKDMHLQTGFIGTPYLCRSLSDNGASEEAYQVFLQEDFPGWLYEVIMGATSIWERWDSIKPDGSISGTGMNSLNHYAYGSIVEWMYRNVCGIKPLETTPGFKKFIVRPEINGHFDHTEVSLQSPMGEIRSRWERSGGKGVTLTLQVPFNTEAEVILDNTSLENVKVSDADLEINQEGQSVRLIIGTGVYSIDFELNDVIELSYGIKTPLWSLKNNPDTAAVLEEYFPHFVNATEEALGFEFPYSIGEVLKGADGFKIGMMLKGADVEAFEKALSEIPYPIRG